MDEFLNFLLILRRRWLPASFVFFGVLALGCLRASQEVERYQANGKLLFQNNTTDVGYPDFVNINTKNQLDNAAVMLTSLELAERTIAKLNLSEDIKSFLKSLVVEKINGTDILEVYYTDEDNKKAAEILNTLMEFYVEDNIQTNRLATESVKDFIAKQLPETTASLKQAEENLRNFQLKHHILDTKAEATSTTSILNDLDKEIGEIEAALAALKVHRESMENIFGVDYQQALASGFVSESPAAGEVLQQLQETQQKIELSKVRFTDNHPDLLFLQEEEKILRDEYNKRLHNTFVGNAGSSLQNNEPSQIPQPGDSQRSFLSQFVNAEVTELSGEKRLQNLQKTREFYQQRLLSLPNLALQQRQLERELQAIETSYQNLLDKYQQLQIQANQKLGNVRIISQARVSENPLPGRGVMSLLQGLIGGILLGSATAVVLEKIDKTVTSSELAKNLLDYPTQGKIPAIPHNNKGIVPQLILKHEPDSSISEAFRMLQTRLRLLSPDRPLKVIAISSSMPKEGKSTVAANLALAFSEIGHNVLLIDGDLRKPTQHKIWNVDSEVGLRNVLRNECQLEQAISKVMPHVDLLPAGEGQENPVAMLDSMEMNLVVDYSRQNYDLVIMDTPPWMVSADTTILGNLADGNLLVVRPGLTNSSSLIASKELLDQSSQQVLGLVLNGLKSQDEYYNQNYYQKVRGFGEAIKPPA